MIEKPKRPKKIPNQDNKQPQTIQELIRRYDLDNTKIYDFLDELVGFLNNKDTYSTEEQIIGKWIGKPLYRKVGYVGNTAISSSETTVRFCELPTDAKPVNVNAVIYTETSGYALFVNSSYSEDGFKIRYMRNIHSIQVIATPDVALEKSFSAYVIMKYIKTTD